MKNDSGAINFVISCRRAISRTAKQLSAEEASTYTVASYTLTRCRNARTASANAASTDLLQLMITTIRLSTGDYTKIISGPGRVIYIARVRLV